MKFWSESSNKQSYFVLQISRTPNIAQKWFCIQNLLMDLSFQKEKNDLIVWYIHVSVLPTSGSTVRTCLQFCSGYWTEWRVLSERYPNSLNEKYRIFLITCNEWRQAYHIIKICQVPSICYAYCISLYHKICLTPYHKLC